MDLRQYFHRWVDPALERISVREPRDGLVLTDLVAESGDREGLEALHSSLDVLFAADPRRYRRVTTDLRAIHLARLEAYVGIYRRGSRTCLLDRAELLGRGATETAGTIVHELTHCRLHDLGISYGREVRDRVERICNREQLRFLLRAQAPSELIGLAERKLRERALTDDEILDHDVRIMMANGVPQTIARVLVSPRRMWSKVRSRSRGDNLAT